MTFSPQEEKMGKDFSICLGQARLLILSSAIFVGILPKKKQIKMSFPLFFGGLSHVDLRNMICHYFSFVYSSMSGRQSDCSKNFKNSFFKFPLYLFLFLSFLLCRHHKSDWSEGHIDSTASSKAIDTIAISSQG